LWINAMLTISSNGTTRNCEGIQRRDFLTIGALSLGGLTLSQLFALKAFAGTGQSIVKDKAVVILNLQGGPTHIETFDPKMTAPREYRAMFGETRTAIPGVTFGSHLTGLARLADRMAIVRSYRHGIGSHGSASEHVAAAGNATKANLGSLYSRIAGVTHPTTGIPLNVVLQPGSVDEEYSNLGAQITRITSTGTLPNIYKPFDPSAGGEIVENMKLIVPESRFDDRRTLLNQLDALKRRAERTGILARADTFQQQAFDVVVGGISEAFDISKEPASIVERYDTSRFDIPASLYKKKNKNLLKQSPISLGKQMLMARRLIEAGVGFVTVTSAGWDMHGNAFGVDDGMPLLGAAMDKAASAFIEDIEQRGMLDRVLLVITGEFGRTPRINKKGGRDHWGNLCTLAFAGGGLPLGQVVGQSDRTASVPASDPVSSAQVLATIMHSLIDIGQLRLATKFPADVITALTASEPIPRLA
jgi:uncharacterized protein (DUF1501 family)